LYSGPFFSKGFHLSGQTENKETAPDVVSFVEKLFRDNPKLSVSVAARQCANAGYRKVYRGDVARIRHKMRAEAYRAKKAAEAATAPVQMPTLNPNAPFVSNMLTAYEELVTGPQEIVVSTPTQNSIIPALSVVPSTQTETNTDELTRAAQKALAKTDFNNKERVKFDRELTHDEWRTLHRDASTAKDKNAIRRRYINARLDKDPSIKPVILDADLMRLFDKGIDRDYIYECCDLAREIHGLERIHRRKTGSRQRPDDGKTAPLVESVVTTAAPAEKLTPMDIVTSQSRPTERVISWVDAQGEPRFMRVRKEHAGGIITSLQEKDGISDDAIEVWGPVKRVKRERVIIDNDVE
jgi:hypothetical protein